MDLELKKGEEIIEEIRKSFFIIFPALLKGIAFALPPIYAFLFYSNDLIQVISWIFLIIIASYFFYNILAWNSDKYIITSMRIVEIKTSGLFNKEVSELPIEKIEDTNYKFTGPFSMLFSYGTVNLFSNSKMNIILENIPEPKRIQALILELKEHLLLKKAKV